MESGRESGREKGRGRERSGWRGRKRMNFGKICISSSLVIVHSTSSWM